MNDSTQKTGSDTPVPAEDNVAALEREARARREAELRNRQDEDTHQERLQPAITRLKKRSRGRATVVFTLLSITLLALAWGSNWVYRSLFRQPELSGQQAGNGPQTRKDPRERSDLGQERVPAPVPPSLPDSRDTGAAAPAVPAPARLDKARFLVRKKTSTTTQAAARTRQEEMILKSASGTAGPGAKSKPGDATPSVRRIPYNPDLYIPENTAIPCSLDYRFVSDRAGKIRCTVTTDIWSASGNTKLIEKGTTATGVYQSGAESGMKQGQSRVFIIMTKLRTRQRPYLDIPLVDTRAAGALGEAGVEGWIDTHFWQRFGGAMMVGMIPDIAAWASNTSGQTDRNTDYTENSREAMAEMARTTLENSINIPPTLYKNQGDLITLITGQDIDFSGVYTLRMKR